MASSMDSVSEKVRAALSEVSEEDQRLFLEEKDKYLKGQTDDSPLLDQLCWVRLITTRLSEGYQKELADYEDRLEARTKMLEGWRKAVTIKATSEFESPMPWLHPFKLAREELQPLEEELEKAITEGETEERDLARLQDVLDKHQLQLPLTSPSLRPKYPPRAVKVYK